MMPSLPRQKIYKLHYANFINDIIFMKSIQQFKQLGAKIVYSKYV